MENKKAVEEGSGRSPAILSIKFLLFSASIIPTLLAGAMAYGSDSFNMFWLILLVFAMFTAQAAGDYLYYYFTNFHSDSRDSHTKIFAGWKPLFTGSLISDKGTLAAGLICLLIDLLIGIYFYIQLGYIVLLMAVAGALVAIFFTPLMLRGYKEIVIFFTFGPLVMVSVFFVLTSEFSILPLAASLPLAFLVTVVAYLKGARFVVKQDESRQMILNIKPGRIKVLFAASYLSLAVLVAAKLLPYAALTAIISIFPAWKLIKVLNSGSSETGVYLNAVVNSILILIVSGLLMAAAFLI